MNAKSSGSRLHTVIATVLFGGAISGFAVLPADAGVFDAPQVTVKYGDLNISSPHGAAVLYRRIRGAAETVCAPYDRSDLWSKQLLNACINKAVLNAVTQVNNFALTAVYSAKNGKKVPMRVGSAAK
jgi:UrcA family protein